MAMARAGVSPLEVGRWTPAQSGRWIKAHVEGEQRTNERMAWMVSRVLNAFGVKCTIDGLLGRESNVLSDEEYARVKARIEERRKANV
jgi:hypothetical protein